MSARRHSVVVAICLLVASWASVDSFCPQRGGRMETSAHIFDKVGEFFQELDNFMDDATARRLGNGAAFYGKRKSNFYGQKDSNKKADPNMPDPTEDFQGPASGGLYKWIQDEDGRMKPVSRRRETPLERNPQFWDRFYEKQAQKENEN